MKRLRSLVLLGALCAQLAVAADFPFARSGVPGAGVPTAGMDASPPADDDALALADIKSPEGRKRRDWRLAVEGASGYRSTAGDGASSIGGSGRGMYGRLSLDVTLDRALGTHVRLVAADRLDVSQEQGGRQQGINTLKELYLSLAASDGLLLDAGRVNTRYGLASGYNPTDFFRVQAIRSLISVDPETLRQNRLGSAMLRAQRLWDDGSFTALYSPRLDDERKRETFSPDWGASNARHRYLLSASQRFAPGFSPEFLLYGVEGRSPQLGLNQSMLLGDATVAYAEWSGGRGPTVLAEALGSARQERLHSRLAVGVSYTSPRKDTLSLEYHLNTAAPDREQWQKVRDGAPGLRMAYRQFALDAQDLPTRHGLFLHYRWKDAGWQGLDLKALTRLDLVDHSSLYWLQVQHAWQGGEVALSGQWHAGRDNTVFGGLAPRSLLELALRFYY